MITIISCYHSVMIMTTRKRRRRTTTIVIIVLIFLIIICYCNYTMIIAFIIASIIMFMINAYD